MACAACRGESSIKTRIETQSACMDARGSVCRGESSIKTRIETGRLFGRAYGFARVGGNHPSKQGLKREMRYIYGANRVVGGNHPSKQGLKRTSKEVAPPKSTGRGESSIKTRIETESLCLSLLSAKSSGGIIHQNKD